MTFRELHGFISGMSDEMLDSRVVVIVKMQQADDWGDIKIVNTEVELIRDGYLLKGK